MHILFLTDNFPPEVNAPASRTFEHCREWVTAGHRVTVITCAPNFPAGKVFEGYRNKLWQCEDMDGIRVIRVWTYITANEGFARRTLDFLSYMVMATVASLFVRRADIIVATSPQFFTAVAGYMAGVLKRRPWVFELRDIWPESIRAVGAMKDSRILDWLERLELFLYRKAAGIVSVTEAFRTNLAARGIAQDKIAVITNGADTARLSPIAKDAELMEKLGLQGKFISGYIGTHGMAHALETLLEAAAILQKRDLRHKLLMIGGGARQEILKAKARQMGLDNVIFTGMVPKEEIARYWSLLDVAIIHLKKEPLFTTVIPSKMFEAMALGIPILMGVDGEARQIVERHGCGVFFEPENPRALVDALEDMKASPERMKGMRLAGRRAALNYDRKRLALRMLALLRDIASGQAS